MRAPDLDPTGEHHGIPTWPWRFAPDPTLRTRRQLRAAGLRPGGQEPAAQVVCRRGKRIAYLYRLDQALPIRPMTPGRVAALDRAMAARQTCPVCRTRYSHCLPLRTLGSCLPCSELTDDERDQLAALIA
ncbi:RRQRL motif-containing zinc-binding protein [Streptomyces sp. NRRL B-24484]|uniref:RRQRL motif-containing zinc-binding protein n=1 Tax=Streptomyces sp. NRRL B-24484 TaxID=1463833 RepID=UPI0005BD0F89|nr:RRQRL motif-containing zinc-binding protein [Streptomyces sp. NRRL B-24484]